MPRMPQKIQQFEPELGEEEKEELAAVVDSGWFTEATRTREFERLFAQYVGRKYAVTATSGTAALFIAMKALDLKNEQNVIVPDLTFVASPNSVIMAGGEVKLVDIATDNLCVDEKILEKSVTPETRGIMPVDFNGRCPDLDVIQEIAQKHGLFTIEDSCHGIGSFYKGRHTGCVSDVGIFSFSTPKIITTGQGGMLVTDNKDLYEKFRMIKDFGRDIDKKHNMANAFDHVMMGFNFKFTEFQAAIGIAQMKKLAHRVERRKKVYSIYRENLSGVDGIEFVDTDLKHVTPWFIDILLDTRKNRDELIASLNYASIGTRMFYPPIHTLTAYRGIKGRFENSINISDRGLWLPSSSFLTDQNVVRVCDEIKRIKKN